MKGPIVILAGEGDTSNAVYNALRGFDVAGIVIEKPVPRSEFLRKRVRKLGVRKVAGQLAFATLALPVLQRRGRSRVNDILREQSLDLSPPPATLIRRVDSVNAPGTIDVIKEMAPAIVVIHGTRILSKRLLAELPPCVLNIHAGITPRYRGVHGGYWALAKRDVAHCGVTVHRVDPGIDTGQILAQELIQPTPADNFATYPYLQLGVGLRLLRECVQATLEDRLEARSEVPAPSQIWSHPTLFEYALNRIRTGAR